MPQRILVYGVTGSGKTTLARQIAQRTGLPFHEMDALAWRPGWVAVDTDEQRRLVASLCAEQRWVIDTAYGVWRDVVLDRAELVVALDYPRLLSLTRLVRRTAIRVIDQRHICNGNTESLRQTFSRDSIIAWHFRSFARKRRRIRGWDSDPDGVATVRLTSSRATKRWLAGLSAE